MTYRLNKGVGRSFEFKGLRTIYVYFALGGFLSAILLYFVVGLFLPFSLTLSIVVLLSLGSVAIAYLLNAKFGENGLSFVRAQWKTIQRLQNDRRVYRLIKVQS